MDTNRQKPHLGSVLVIGGGLAGLAAASVLSRHGVAVEIMESRDRLGGRASSFHDPASGEWVDNCQHVSMGCCTNLKHFCRTVGIVDHLMPQRWLYFQDETGHVSRFGGWRLPCPLHLAPSFVFARFLTMTEKLRIAYGFHRLLREPQCKVAGSFQDWLLANGQTRRTCERFWGLILVSALNETLDRVEYRYARQVFVEGFLWNRGSSVVEIPDAPLGDFYGKPLQQWLAEHDVKLSCQTAAKQLFRAGDQVERCETRSGESRFADHYLLAVPFQRVTSLLPTELVTQHDCFSRIDSLRSSPITSVHLWYDRPVMNHPHLVPVGRTIQWLFRRSDVSGSSGNGSAQYIQAVISASRELAADGNDRVLESVLAEIGQILPEARMAKLTHHRVVTERSATYSVVPGVDEFRPDQRTPVANLWLAGDYTRTDWPATMEGAVRSGYLAAEKILAKMGRPIQAIQPPLPLCLLTCLALKRA